MVAEEKYNIDEYRDFLTTLDHNGFTEALNQKKIDDKNKKFAGVLEVKNFILDLFKTIPVIGNAFENFDELAKKGLDHIKNILKAIGFADNEISSIANEKEGSDVANSLTDYIAKKNF